MDLKEKKILVTGGDGFLGRFVLEELEREGVRRRDMIVPRFPEVDLRRWDDCARAVEGVDAVVHLAAKVGGIGYNRRNPATLFYDNIVMGAHLMEAARQGGVEKFLQVGTVCAYPKETPVPFREERLWDGYPEETNAPYGVAKKALLVQAQAYRQQYGMNVIFILPVNLYGPGDNFDLEDSHVIPALIRKCVDAAESGAGEITVWGSGRPTREFLYVEDCARGLVLALKNYDDPEPVNFGSGQEITIRDLVELIVGLTGFEGEVRWDADRPDGQMRRCLDTSRAEVFGFRSEVGLKEGLDRTIHWYRTQRRQAE
ncbi:MAG: GDP-L-fucose synthase [bacterium]|nr:MAG: GDP-L-fucose synthase [bacterium]